MSHLRVPAARTDRREGGRHGRPDTRSAVPPLPPLPDASMEPQLRRLAVLPPLAVLLAAGAAVLYALCSTGTRPQPALYAVLGGAVAVALAAVVIALVAAGRAAGSVGHRVAALRTFSARGETELGELAEALRRGETPPIRRSHGGRPDASDDFELLAADLARAQESAVAAVVAVATGNSGATHAGSGDSRASASVSPAQKLEVFLNLARRLQSLVDREISALDDLQSGIEDPDLLKSIFHVDHLATRIRRHAESLAVLGGAGSRRQWNHPVAMTEVLRSAIAEVEQYARVRLVPPVEGTLRGHAVADVVHLLAELVENATVFSAPHTQVLLRASAVTAGLAVEVEDRGLGMPVAEQQRMNALLADPCRVDVAGVLTDGRIGLYVVSQLARRHGIEVRLQSNIYGGVQAVLVLPQTLLGTEPDTTATALEPAVPGRQPQGPEESARQPQGQEEAHEDEADRRRSADTVSTVHVTGPAALEPRVRTTHARPVTGPAGTGAQEPTAPTMAGQVRLLGSAGPALVGTPPPLPTRGRHRQRPAPEPGPAAAPENMTAGSARRIEERPVEERREQRPVEERLVEAGAETGTAARQTVGIGTGSGTGPEHRKPAGDDAGRSARPVPPVPPVLSVPAARSVLSERPGTGTGAGAGPGRGTVGRPGLPRRRAQEHLAPQLRNGPARREQAADHEEGSSPTQLAGHDPGLMAAFQRGFARAQAQAPAPAESTESTGSTGSTESPDSHGQADRGSPDGPPAGPHPAHPNPEQPQPAPHHPHPHHEESTHHG